MLYYNADPRDGGSYGSICQPCCCQPVHLRPGETNLLMIDYSMWALPIGWIVPTLEYSIEQDESSCPTNGPTNVNFITQTPLNTAAQIDLTTLATGTSPLTYEAPLPLSGPQHGKLSKSGTDAGLYSYKPNNGFQGYDYFDFETTDANGLSVINTATIRVGAYQNAKADSKRTSKVPVIDVKGIQTDGQNQLVKFPIYMPTSCRACDSYKLTIKQPAKDCDGNLYNHFTCFNLTCTDC